MTKTYGWAVDLAITKIGETSQHIIAINLSLPGGADGEDWLGKDEEETAFESWGSKGVFLPWNWKNLNWVLFKKNDDIWNSTDFKIEVNNVDPDLNLKSAIADSLSKLPKENWKPFDAQNIQKNSTLVHSLAPLGYLPSNISTSLNMSFSAICEDNLEAGEYAVFPTFDFEYKTDDYKTANYEASSISKLGDYASCQYSQIGGLDFNIKFYCNIESKISNSSDWPTLSLEKVGLKNQTQIKLNILNFLSPIAIWKQLVDKLISDNLAQNNIELIYTYLIRAIGAGWDFSYRENRLGETNTIEDKNIVYENLINTFSNKDLSIEVSLPTDTTKPALDTKFDGFMDYDFDENLKDFRDFLKCYQQINHEANEDTKKTYKKQFMYLLPKIFNLLNDAKIFNQISVIFWLFHNQKNIASPSPIIKNLFNKISKQEILQTVIDKAMYASIFEPIWLNTNIIKLSNIVTDRELTENEVTEIKQHLLAGCIYQLDIITKIEEEIEKIICDQVDRFIEESYHRKQELTQYDSGIKFKFAFQTDNSKDELFRGYAIGLQVGSCETAGAEISWKRSSWITDVQLLINKVTKFSDEFLHETIGATQVDSKIVGYFEFTGNPILASRWGKNAKGVDDFVNKSEIVDPDGTDYIEYIWHEGDYQKNFPLLGYGLFYKGIAIPIGNAGEIFDKSLYVSHPTKLINASQAIDTVKSIIPQQYLSCVPPGAPTVIFDAESLTKLQELSEETKAYAYQSLKKINKPLPVALLCNDELSFIKEKCKSRFKLRFHRPIPTADFYEKWLNGASENGVVSKIEEFNKLLSSFFKIDKKSLQKLDLLDNGTDEDKEIAKYLIKLINDVCIHHPAVENLLLKVFVNNEEPKEKLLKLNQLKTLEIKILGMTTMINEGPSDDFSEVLIKSGSFCKVELFSLIKEEHFTGADKKFNSDVFDNSFKNDKKEVTNKVEIEGAEYRQFGPAEYWFEAAPNAEYEVKGFDVSVNVQKSFVDLSIAKANTIDATWIRGVEFQRHEWHWTGYPVTFPKVDGVFDRWLSSFVGVESYRQEDNYVLNSHIDEKNGWTIGDGLKNPVVVHQHQLASGPRPAKYFAFSVRPKIRFSKWIISDAQIRKDIESKIFANGTLAKGIPIDVLQDRIPVPLLKWAIPLTATYAKSETDVSIPVRTQNGNMLIFDEAFRRTDSLVRFGGIGDTLDIEVMGTRIRDIHEFGPNSIYQGYEILADQTLLCDEPFGLTYDITRNAKVAQTGIVVRPQIAKGKWMLAKVRARRLINPDTLELKPVIKMTDGSFELDMRKVGDMLVPTDFSIDFESNTTLRSLKFGDKVYTGNYQLKPASRFLVSFEKFDGLTGWKIGVTAQLKNNNLDYETIDRVSSFSDKPLEVDEITQLITLEINENKDTVRKIKPLIISDYTDPIWLSFIGSFGIDATLLEADECSIRIDADKLTFKSDAHGLINNFRTHAHDSACFQALMVYEPVQDIYRTGKELDGGRFIGFYVYESIAGKDANFVNTKNSEITNISDDAYAYLITIQKATAIKQVEVSGVPNKFQDFFKSNKAVDLELMDLLFPEPIKGDDEILKPVESKIRITPEYMGPIKIVKSIKSVP